MTPAPSSLPIVRLLTAVAILVAVFAAIAGPTSAADTPPDSAAITLITGDVIRHVATGDGTGVRFEPGPGRTGVGYAEQRVDGRLRIVPRDVVDDVALGRLDPRLFDLDLLERHGYADDDVIPVIVQYADGKAPAALRAAGVRAVRRLDSIDAVAVQVSERGAATALSRLLDQRDLRTIWLDGRIEPALAESVPRVGAPAAWSAGLTGAGVEVGVLDTGIDPTHPDLAGRVAAAEVFTEQDGNHRHGTHVASTIAGSGAGSGERYVGVALDAELLDAKVCAAGECAESAIVAGMEWAVAEGAEVVNLSVGTAEPSDGSSPLEQAIDRMSAASDVLFVVAAGNFGVVGSPGAAAEALTVGAVDKTDELAEGSGAGPRRGDSLVKPEIVAPGVDIIAAVPGGYGALTGTSMAAPHVAGAAALLAQRHADWGAARLKSALTASARPLPGLGVFQQGGGRLDVARAVEQPVTVEPATLAAQLPARAATTRDLTYTNAGDTDATLTVRAELADPSGQRVAAEAVAIEPSTVVVPAGGSTTATVTFAAPASGAGVVAGYVIAGDGAGRSLRVPVSIAPAAAS